MGQLTIARFRGDTTFGLAARIIATFVGGVVGMLMWYISSGSGTASPFAFAAVCAVCFPFFFMVVLYCPIPPMTRLVMFVTAVLVSLPFGDGMAGADLVSGHRSWVTRTRIRTRSSPDHLGLDGMLLGQVYLFHR